MKENEKKEKNQPLKELYLLYFLSFLGYVLRDTKPITTLEFTIHLESIALHPWVEKSP